jgi:hypothetical protein
MTVVIRMGLFLFSFALLLGYALKCRAILCVLLALGMLVGNALIAFGEERLVYKYNYSMDGYKQEAMFRGETFIGSTFQKVGAKHSVGNTVGNDQYHIVVFISLDAYADGGDFFAMNYTSWDYSSTAFAYAKKPTKEKPNVPSVAVASNYKSEFAQVFFALLNAGYIIYDPTKRFDLEDLHNWAFGK